MSDNPFSPNNPLTGPVRVTLKISETKPVPCPCGCTIFLEGMVLRRVSPILSGGNKSDIVPIMPIVYCAKCFKPMPDLLPDELKQEYIDVESTVTIVK